MDWLKRMSPSALLGMGRGTLAATFNEELHYQAGWVLLFACTMSLAWLTYIPLDLQLHPEQPIIVMLRWLLVVVSAAILLIRRIPVLRQRSQWLLALWGAYVLGASGAITGVSAVDPTYVSGFILVICLIPMVPLQVRYSLTLLVIGLGSFFASATATDAVLTSPSARYTLNDLAVASLIVVFFIFLMNTYRYRTWKSAKVIERESTLRVQQASLESQAKSRFIATMSHEIRTPMNGVMGMAEMLHTTALSKEQKNFVDVITYSSKSLLNVINDILDYSKIEAGRVTLEKVDFSVFELCAEVGSLFQSSADTHSLEFVVCVDPAIPSTLKGDPSRLRQVLLNLIGNAFKFTRVGRVELRVEKGAPSVDGGTLAFTILDTGIGISQAQQAALFKPFQQADSTITREYGGTGLGLSISKSLIELMGGAIQVDSAPRQGSTFTFSMHYETADVPRSQAINPRLRGVRVLLVGRPSHYGMELTRHLLHWGTQVESERSVADAPTRLRAVESPYHAVLLDLDSNSDVDPSLLEQLASASAASAASCLLLSAEPNPSARFTVLTKPICAYQVQVPLAQALGLEWQPVTGGDGERMDQVLAGCRVLVAEDNDINQKVITSMLDKLGADYRVAQNGRQALADYQQHHDAIDVVLMDCEMPILDGEGATRQIRQWEQAQGLPRKPVIALTAHAMREQVDSCRAAGMDDHIAKPVELGVLRDTVLAALQRV